MNGSVVSGTGSAPAFTVALVDDPDIAAEACAALLEGVSFQSGAGWWRCTIGAALPPAARAVFAICRCDGRPVGLLPLIAAGKTLTSLTTPYTTLYQTLIAPGLAPDSVSAMGAAIGHAVRPYSTLRLDALDAASPSLGPLLAGLRRAGWFGHRFDAFGNWHEPLDGRDWTSYLAARPGWLRNLVRRKITRGTSDMTLRIARTTSEAADAIQAYRTLHARSWKQPEPFPRFDAAVTQQAAHSGALRLGVLQCGGRLLAAQYWIVSNGAATVLKLAHDETAKSLSPGTILTAMMIRLLLDEGGVTSLDFGRGDDAYKQSWATHRRQRIGVMLARPMHPRGLAVFARGALGAGLRRWRGSPGG